MFIVYIQKIRTIPSSYRAVRLLKNQLYFGNCETEKIYHIVLFIIIHVSHYGVI